MKKFVFLFIGLMCAASNAQQIPDKSFEPEIPHPAYASGKGSLVLLDEAHHNFHTMDGRYHVFAKVLQTDGYRVQAGKSAFSPALLKDAKILVIANALNAANVENWQLPTPSAFTPEEIRAVNAWVKNGGSLLLIADHMPMPGASFDLGKAFGFTFYNGYASETLSGLFPGQKKELDVFTKAEGTLATHAITNGRNVHETVDQVQTFTGQGFQIPENAASLLTFGANYEILLPDTAWVFDAHTPRIPAKGLSQGAVLEYGKGRVAVFGEAAMFSGQLKGENKTPFGLNAPTAKQNIQFLLNLIHWLDKQL
ncbi:hypothetical protein AGMMS49545_15420 [Betaproteobacteria bacterium]|nr:hypothetical protein AGMMS49545_15420 [Betaproteobacteria bacterium]GHU45996.1 hypothetical protein AGMMS50289_18360 [Betaproteobacteria bacterium]